MMTRERIKVGIQIAARISELRRLAERTARDYEAHSAAADNSLPAEHRRLLRMLFAIARPTAVARVRASWITRKAAISAKRRPLAPHGSNVLRALSHISLSDGWGGWVGEQMAVSRNPDK